MRVIIVVAIILALGFFGYRYLTGQSIDIGGVVDSATQSASDGEDAATEAGEAAVENATEAASDAAASVSEAEEAATEAASDAVEATAEAANEAVENTAEAASNVVEGATEAAGDAVESLSGLSVETVRETIAGLGLSDEQMATIEPMLSAAENNPELLEQVIEQAKQLVAQ